jgi:CRP-like cAMP-binding protein
VPRTANVVAKTKCFIAALRINEMNEIMQHYPEIADEIRIEADDRYQVLLKKGKVSQSPIFSFTTVKVRDISKNLSFLGS